MLYYINTHISVSPAGLSGVNSRSLPNILAGGILLMGLFLAFMSLPGLKEKSACTPAAAGKRTVLWFAAVFAVYVACISVLGFFTATTLFLLAVFAGLGVKWTVALPVTAATGALLYLLFVMFMRVPLPNGWLV